MAWLFSPLGIGIVVAVIVALASLIYWKRAPIKGWLGRQKVKEIELGAGPLKVTLEDKSKSPQPAGGVNFGEGNDFSRAKVRTAERDIRRGDAAAAAGAPGGKAPGVNYGRNNQFPDAEITAAGRDIVDTGTDQP